MAFVFTRRKSGLFGSCIKSCYPGYCQLSNFLRRLKPRCPEAWNFPARPRAAAALEVKASLGHKPSQAGGLMKAF